MFLATVFLAGRQWLPWAGLFLVVAVGLLVWAYRTGPEKGPLRTVCFALKLLGLIALLACLVEPLWSGERPKPGSNLFAIVADNSQGMQIKDSNASESRGVVLKRLLTDNQSTWQSKLEADFQLRRYLFDARLLATRDYSELNFDGRASSIGIALQGLGERFHGQPLAGVLLFTDGNATDIGDTLPNLTGLPPIYPVVSGNDLPIKDLAINKVTTTQTVFEDAPVSVQADVLAGGYSGQRILAELVDVSTNRPVASTNKTAGAAGKTNSPVATVTPSGKVVASQILTVQAATELLTFRFNVRPDQPGLSFLRLRVSARDETNQFEHPDTSVEATLANNQRVMVVDRGRGPYNVLYLSGRPDWEYKFLHRAIDEDDQVRMVALIRVAKPESRKNMTFRGRPGESSNPLFRGFENQAAEDVQRYDEPVLVRQNVKDEMELRTGFPKLPEDLYPYHAVILDRVEAEFFTADQMALLQKFVSERGGGLLMLGGAESFYEGKYQRTPIGDMLPVYLDRPPDTKPPDELRINLTREGWLQPWARLRNNESDERNRISDMPSFLGILNQVRDVKPGASVIAKVADPSGKEYPALAAQRFGRGRTAALMIGDLWHWGFRDEAAHKDMDKAWRQMVRWLVADVPNAVELTAQPILGDPNQSILLQLRVRDKKFQPLDSATVSMTVKLAADMEPQLVAKPGAEPIPQSAPVREIKLLAEPSLSEPGVYQATYVPRHTGGYLAEATVIDAVGAEVGRAQAGWTSDPAAEEFKSLKPNRALLESIARKTGGEIVAADKLAEFVGKLSSKKAPIMESYTNPLWHTPALFGFALLCFAGEWGIRRWKGYA